MKKVLQKNRNNEVSSNFMFIPGRKIFLTIISLLIYTSSFADPYWGGYVTATRLSETNTTVTYRLNVSIAFKIGATNLSVPFMISGRDSVSFYVPMKNSTVDASGEWENSSGTAIVTLNKSKVPTKIYYSLANRIMIANQTWYWDEYIILNTSAPGSSPVSTLPAVIKMPINQTAATYTIPASDPDAGSTLTYGIPPFAGTFPFNTEPSGFPINPSTGQITLNTVGKTACQLYNAMITITDNNGNQILLYFQIKIIDPTPPVIHCPVNIIVQAPRNDCSPIVNWTTPSITENCTYTVTSNYHSGDRFKVGTTTVNYSVTDASGNKASCSFKVTVTPNPLVATISAKKYAGGYNISCKGKNDGEATVTLIGGCLPYKYEWSTVPKQTTNTAEGLVVGTYTVIMTDANGTKNSASIALTEPAQLVASAGNNQTVYFGYAPYSYATLNGVSTGGVPTYNYLWSNGATTSSTMVSPSIATSYTFTVTDVNGCVANNTVTVCAIDVRYKLGRNHSRERQCNKAKVMICHKMCKGRTQTLLIDASDVAFHLAHGDQLGECGLNISCFPVSSLSESEVDSVEKNDEVLLKENNDVTIYPNPSDGNFNVRVKSDNLEPITLSVTARTGEVLLHTVTKNLSGLVQMPIDLKEYNNGIYSVRVESGTTSFYRKIIIRK